jgi:AcrR family transcriptional regulator
MTPTTTKPRRADAQRNYERILAAARTAVVERGVDVSLEDVARDAGVGIGTLYRHFPTRLALLEAIFIDKVEELRARAEALAQGSSAFDALVTWLRLQMDLSAQGRCMGAAVMNAKHTEGSDMQVAYVSMRRAGDALLARAQAAGEARPGVEMPDVLRLIHGVVLANEQLADPERATAMFDLVVAGIRA